MDLRRLRGGLVAKRRPAVARSRARRDVLNSDLEGMKEILFDTAADGDRSEESGNAWGAEESTHEQFDADMEPAPASSRGETDTDSTHTPAGADARQEQSAMPTWLRMRPEERALLYVSPDGLEAHYLVAADRQRNYHKSSRDFVTVGYRRVPCSDGSVLVGWCDAVRGCAPELHYRRGMFPEAALPHSTVADVTARHVAQCRCSQRLLDAMGGERQLGFDLHRGARAPPKGTAAIVLDAGKFGGVSYKAVNTNAHGESVFVQWGVSKTSNEGHYHCMKCTSTPRHCIHNKTLLDTIGAPASGAAKV